MAAGAGLLVLLWAAAMVCCSRDVGVFATKQAKTIVPVLPLYFLVSYGAYSLASIGWALVVFNDVPHEAALLEKVAGCAAAVLWRKARRSHVSYSCSVI